MHFGKGIGALLGALSVIMTGVTQVAADNEERPVEGRFEVVAQPGASPATLHDYTICPGPDGEPLLVMTFRRDGFILAVDLETGETRRHFLDGLGWAIATGPDGKVYLGTSLSPGSRLLRYDPAAEAVEDLGAVWDEQILYWLEASADGKMYGGTFPGALLVSYDIESNRLEDLGAMDEEQTYNIFGAVAEDGLVYSGLGMQEQKLIEYNPATGEKRNIWPEDWRESNGARVFKSEDGLVYAYPGIPTESSQGRALKIRPGGEVEIVDRSGRQAMGRVPPSRRAQPLLGNGWRLMAIDEHEVVLRHEAGEEPDRHIALEYEGAVKPIYSLGRGPGGKIYGTSKPTVLFSFDPATGESEDLRAYSPSGAQIDTLGGSGGKLYMGTYTGANLHVFDPENPQKGSRRIGALGEDQDRPRSILPDGRGGVFLGSVPRYGELGGALVHYDPAEEVPRAVRNVIPGQSIQSLAFDKELGRLYLGGSVHGGSGSTPGTEEALLAEWDLSRGKATRFVTPVPGEKVVMSLVAVPGGLLCGLTRGGVWFGIDPETFSVLFQVEPGWGEAPWHSSVAYDSNREVIYGVVGRTLFRAPAANPEAIEAIGQYPGREEIFAGVVVDDFGAVYFSHGTDLVRWTPERMKDER